MPHPSSKSTSHHGRLALSRRPSRGFALLITITLLAFLVLLLVSLASLTRVETQVAGNSQHLSQARQNALLALNIAMGQLQKTIGPDQRVTAEADLMASTFSGGPAYNATEASFDTYWAAKSRHWTGAWGNGATQIDTNYSLSPGALPANPYRPLLLSWLVSGNEAVSFNQSADGSVNSPGTIPYTPDSPIANLTAATALSTNITIGGQPAQLLVGPASVPTATSSKCDYVAAPLVNIQVPASQIPGAGSSSTLTPIGRYAYWVGDEGVKARANLIDNYLQQTTTANQDLAKAYSYAIAQHSGINFMDLGIATNQTAANAATSIIGRDYNYNNTAYVADPLVVGQYIPDSLPSTTTTTGALARVATAVKFSPPFTGLLVPNQLPFIAATNPTSTSSPLSNSPSTATNLSTILKNRFHDITLSSSGVLSDPYAGGLKKDLSSALAKNSTTPAAGTPLFKPNSSGDLGVPTWGLLRSYAQTRNDPTRMAQVLPSATQMGHSFLVTFADLGFGTYIRNSDKHLILTIHPIVALWAPVTYLLKSPTYEVAIGLKGFGSIQFAQSVNGGSPVALGAPVDVMGTLGTSLNGTPYLRFLLNSNSTGNVGWYSTRIFGAPDQTNAATPAIYQLTPLSTPVTTTGVTNPLLLGQGNNSDPTPIDTTGQNFLIYDTGLVVTMPSPAAPVDIVMTASGGSTLPEMSIILTDTGGLKTGAAFGNAAAGNWYQAVNHVIISGYSSGQYLGTYTATNSTYNLNADPTHIFPLFALRAQQILGGQGNNQNINIGMPLDYQPRFLAATNLRAPLSVSTKYDQLPVPHNVSFGGILKTGIGTTQLNIYNADNPGGAARIATDASHSGGVNNGRGLTTFDLLREDIPLMSIGQLQNANLSILDCYPAFALGNSSADIRIPRDQTYVTSIVEDPATPGTYSYPYYDVSWHLNRNLWDQYFVSTVPSGGMTGSAPVAGGPSTWTQTEITNNIPLPNARMNYYYKNGVAPLKDNLLPSGSGYRQSAANLMLAGAFNVNSTSEQAWRATVGGTYNVPYRPYYTSRGTATISIGYDASTKDMYWQEYTGTNVYLPNTTTPRANISFPRSITSAEAGPKVYGTTDPVATQYSGSSSPEKVSFWYGNRELSLVSYTRLPGVITEFATNLVQEIRRRAQANNGPFLAMSDFVNRRLVSNSNTYKDTGLKGTIQAALDANNTSLYAVNPNTPLVTDSRNLRSTSPDTTKFGSNPNYDYAHMIGSDTLYGPPTTSTPACTNRSAFGPKFITQADILSAIGPGLAARSDTFTIRTYGEVVNPVTQVVEGRAWCEAVVQRLPYYIDQTDSGLSSLGDATPPSSLNSQANKTFGRRIKIIRFRWLGQNDI